MAINFPNSPTTNDTHVVGNVTWTWDGTTWTAAGTGGSSYANSDVDTHLNTGTATSGQILSWTGTDYDWVADQNSGGIALSDLSVTVASAGSANLAYNNGNGTFTYTPPDLSSYLTSYTETQTFDDVLALGATTNRAVTINNTLTVDALDSTGIGFANLVSASDIVLNATGDINASSSKITNVLDPTAAQDAATKAYVDTNIASAGSPTFSVTAPDSGRYQYTGDGFPGPEDNPTLFLYKGHTYYFNLSVSGHPFHIQTSSGAYNASNLYTAGMTNAGAQSGTLTWTVPMSAPNTLYYVCQYHSAMAGTITII